MEEERKFTEAELVEFGTYLLSDQRTKSVVTSWDVKDSTSLSERLKVVYHADIENFKAIKAQ